MTDAPLFIALILATGAGASIPIGAALARRRLGILPGWLDTEARHTIIAFGAGALLAAVALVLVPEGAARLSPVAAVMCFLSGGVIFAFVDALLSRSETDFAQFAAMMMDYLPEALALGALVTGDIGAAILVAALIGLQNLPEGFNAMREMAGSDLEGGSKRLWIFVAMVPLGPLAAALGLFLSPAYDPAIGAVMLLAAGGILYLMLQDIAPQVPLRNAYFPPLGAIVGFALGLAGHLMVAG